MALKQQGVYATTTATDAKKSLKKVNLRRLKLYRAYSISFNSSVNVGKIFLELNSKELHQSSGKEKESCFSCVPVLDKM